MTTIGRPSGVVAPVGTAPALPGTRDEAKHLMPHTNMTRAASKRLARKQAQREKLQNKLKFRQRSRSNSFEDDVNNFEDAGEEYHRRLGLNGASQRDNQRGGGGDSSGGDSRGQEERQSEEDRTVNAGSTRPVPVPQTDMVRIASQFVGSDEARDHAVRRASIKFLGDLARNADENRATVPAVMLHAADRLALKPSTQVGLADIRELLMKQDSLRDKDPGPRASHMRLLLPILMLNLERPRTDEERAQARQRYTVLAGRPVAASAA